VLKLVFCKFLKYYYAGVKYWCLHTFMNVTGFHFISIDISKMSLEYTNFPSFRNRLTSSRNTGIHSARGRISDAYENTFFIPLYILSRFLCVTNNNGVSDVVIGFIRILTHSHNSGLRAITALSLISTLYNSSFHKQQESSVH
jgi:hypothetical protein